MRRIEHGAYARCEEALAIARALNASADALFGGVFDRLKAGGEKDPLCFGSDPEVSKVPHDPGADHGQLHALLEHIEGARGHKPFATFFDEDGEQVTLQLNAVALVTVPHVLLWGAYDEDLDDVPEPHHHAAGPN